MSRVSAHGCLNITRDFGPHGHLSRIKIPYNRSCYSGTMKCGYMGAYLGVGACPGQYSISLCIYTDSMIILYFVHHYFVCYSAAPILSETVRKCPLCQRCNLVIKRKRDGGYVNVHSCLVYINDFGVREIALTGCLNLCDLNAQQSIPDLQ